MLTMWESFQDLEVGRFLTAFHEGQFITPLHGSQPKTATIFVEESIASSMLPHHDQEGVKRKCVLRWWEKEGVAWQLFPHTFLHSVLQNIKEILLGRAIHTVYLYDNSVRPDPYLTDTPWKSLRQVLVALWSESKGFWFKIKQHNNKKNLLNKTRYWFRSISSSIASYAGGLVEKFQQPSWK